LTVISQLVIWYLKRNLLQASGAKKGLSGRLICIFIIVKFKLSDEQIASLANLDRSQVPEILFTKAGENKLVIF
jgi:hypothetical protein